MHPRHAVMALGLQLALLAWIPAVADRAAGDSLRLGVPADCSSINQRVGQSFVLRDIVRFVFYLPAPGAQAYVVKAGRCASFTFGIGDTNLVPIPGSYGPTFTIPQHATTFALSGDPSPEHAFRFPSGGQLGLYGENLGGIVKVPINDPDGTGTLTGYAQRPLPANYGTARPQGGSEVEIEAFFVKVVTDPRKGGLVTSFEFREASYRKTVPVMPAPSPSPTPSPHPFPVAPAKITLKLVYRIPLDRNSKAAEPDDESDIGPAPPDVVASGVIPRIVLMEQAVVFLRADGTFIRRLPLDDDVNLVKRADLSPRGTHVVIGSSLSPRFLNDPDGKEEGGWSPETFAVYDSSGSPVVKTTGTNDDYATLTDGGAILLHEIDTGHIKPVNQSTGVQVSDFQFLGPYGSGPPQVALSKSGYRFVVGASRLTINGNGDPAVVFANERTLVTSSVNEAWVGMFDGTGKQLWTRQLPDTSLVTGVGVWDDGSYVLVTTDRYSPQHTFVDRRQFLLDGAGNVLFSTDAWGGGSLIDAWPELGGFLLGGTAFNQYPRIVHLDGTLTTYPYSSQLTLEQRSRFFVTGAAVGPSLVAFIGYFEKLRVDLVLADVSGRLLCEHSLGSIDSLIRARRSRARTRPRSELDTRQGEILLERLVRVTLSQDQRFVAVRLPGEVRVYALHSAPGE